MKIKVSDAKGAALDWLVAKCDGRRMGFTPGGGLEVRGRTESGEELPEQWDMWMPWHPSTDWSQGGPIIEREQINVGLAANNTAWIASMAHLPTSRQDKTRGYGPTPLIAAMRCYVFSKLGEEVDVPDALN